MNYCKSKWTYTLEVQISKSLYCLFLQYVTFDRLDFDYQGKLCCVKVMLRGVCMEECS